MTETALLGIDLLTILDVWAALTECRHGVNGFGGDTAEIYAYTLQKYDPLAHGHTANRIAQDEELQRLGIGAARALATLLDLFCTQHECSFDIDGLYYKDWLHRVETGDILFHHRAHVRYREDR